MWETVLGRHWSYSFRANRNQEIRQEFSDWASPGEEVAWQK